MIFATLDALSPGMQQAGSFVITSAQVIGCLLLSRAVSISATQVIHEPKGSQIRDLLERAGFFKEVSGSRYDREFLLTDHLRQRLPVHADYLIVFASNNEQRGRLHAKQCRSREIWPATPRNHCLNQIWPRGSSHKSSASAGACAEIAERKASGLGLILQPLRGVTDPSGEEPDIESQMSPSQIDVFFGLGQQIEKQRA
jgi:hypothetical protein